MAKNKKKTNGTKKKESVVKKEQEDGHIEEDEVENDVESNSDVEKSGEIGEIGEIGEKNGEKLNGSIEKDDVIIGLQAQIEQLTVELNKKETQIVDHSGEFEDLKAQLKTSRELNDGYEPKIKQLESKIDGLMGDLEEKNKLIRVNSGSNEEIDVLKTQLKKAEEESAKHRESYEQLLSRLSSVKSVFANLKETQAELESCRDDLNQKDVQLVRLNNEVAELKTENSKLNKSLAVIKEETNDLNNECDRLSHDLSKVRREFQSKDNLFTQEKDVLDSQMKKLTIKNEELKASLQEYNILLEENKIQATSLVAELEEARNVSVRKDSEINVLNDEKSSFLNDIMRLKKYIQDEEQIKEQELQQWNKKIEELDQQIEMGKSDLGSSQAKINELEEQVTRLARFEQESKEKQLQIGKLRHEAIILNEHLTKALKLMKKDMNSDTVDKELVSNLFISFLSLPRGDNKKFEALQLISSFLGWNEEKKISAGLSHKPSGKKSGNGENEGGVRESFVSLWTDYLEKESTKK